MGDARRWTGGRVYTGRRYVESILVDGGRVVAAGTEEEVRRSSPTGTEHAGLGGRLLLPGLVDAHLHVAELARVRTGLALDDLRSTDGLTERLGTWAGSHPVGPIVGRGWDAERLRGPPVDLRTIDRVVSDRPVVLYHISGHAALANSAALAEAGRLEPAREGPTVGRFSDGTPNGLLYEEALRWIRPAVEDALQVPPEELRATLEWAASFGLTSVATMNAHPAEVVALADLDGQGRLPISVRAYAALDSEFEQLPTPAGPESPSRFRVVGVKAFADGAFGPRTAWLTEPYQDAPEGSGQAVGDDGTLGERIARAVELGLAPAVHAIGDRGLARALTLLAPWAAAERPRPARVEHASLTPPDLWPGLEAVGPTLVVQPGFILSDHWLGRRLGRDRARWSYAFRSLLDRGLHLAGSSDAPFDPVDPWRGIRAAVERRDAFGRSANPTTDEAVPIEAALRLYTEGSARAVGDPIGGHLEPGARADLVVIDGPDLASVLVRREVPVAETWVEGVRLFRRAVSAKGTTI